MFYANLIFLMNADCNENKDRAAFLAQKMGPWMSAGKATSVPGFWYGVARCFSM